MLDSVLSAGHREADKEGVQLWAWTDRPLAPGQLNKPCNLSEPQFPGLQNGKKK